MSLQCGSISSSCHFLDFFYNSQVCHMSHQVQLIAARSANSILCYTPAISFNTESKIRFLDTIAVKVMRTLTQGPRQMTKHKINRITFILSDADLLTSVMICGTGTLHSLCSSSLTTMTYKVKNQINAVIWRIFNARGLALPHPVTESK